MWLGVILNMLNVMSEYLAHFENVESSARFQDETSPSASNTDHFIYFTYLIQSDYGIDTVTLLVTSAVKNDYFRFILK